MATLELSGQSLERADIAPKLLKLKNLLDDRKDMWAKIPFEKRKAWMQSGKDPVMDIAWDVWNYLKNNFFGEKYYDNSET